MAKSKLKFKVGEVVSISLSTRRQEPLLPKVRNYLDRAPKEHRVGKISGITFNFSGYIYNVRLVNRDKAKGARGPTAFYFYCSARELSLFHGREEPVQLCLF